MIEDKELLEKRLAEMSREEKIALAQALEEQERRKKERKFFTYYPDEGPLRRELYPKHVAFFKAGASKIERLFLAGNRVGKTEGAGGFETTCHLTGLYPAWWEGKTFTRPIDSWAAGDTKETVRDIIQLKMMGNIAKGEIGTGLIPKHLIVDYSRRPGISDTLDSVFVKHVTGGVSQLSFKSYDQGRISFQGTKKDLIWLDEEPPLDIYTECLLRTTDTANPEIAEEQGLMILTFTPLEGMSETVMSFLPGGEIVDREEASKYVVMATWDDVPHLSAKTKEIMWNAIPPYQRDARSKGVPQLGSGAIFPVPESDITVDPFDIPPHWPRVYGMDVGWKRTAVIWGAWDRENDVVYLYAEHYRGQAEPSIHAEAIKAKGDWVPGVIDPAARGRSQKDGWKLLEDYKDNQGLDIETAFNGVESGLYEVWQRLSTGRLKIFRSLSNWLYEYRLYRRDDKGKIVKENDHLMDATRYLIMSGLERAKVKPVDRPKNTDEFGFGSGGSSGGGWMGG
jgi:phage terminase large subunit-like protein